jgi:hypothetical protein
MPELPIISGDEAIRVLKRLGFYETRQKAVMLLCAANIEAVFASRSHDLRGDVLI